MLGSDHKRGEALLIVACAVFLYYTIWVIVLPFADDDDDRLKWLFYSPRLALMVPAISGLFFVGGLMVFTAWHVRPYLSGREKVD